MPSNIGFKLFKREMITLLRVKVDLWDERSWNALWDSMVLIDFSKIL